MSKLILKTDKKNFEIEIDEETSLILDRIIESEIDIAKYMEEIIQDIRKGNDGFLRERTKEEK